MLDFNKEIERIFGGASSDIHKLAEENRKRTEENLKRFSKELEDSLNHLHEIAKPTVSGYEDLVEEIKASRAYRDMIARGTRGVIERSIGNGMMLAVHTDGSYEIAPKPIACSW